MTEHIEPPLMRWDTSKSREVEAPRVQAFLAEVLEVCRRHGYAIGHEDAHGAFIISPYDASTAEWLADAMIQDAEP